MCVFVSLRCVSFIGGVSLEACAVTSVERTAYRVFPRLVMPRELYLFYSPSAEGMAWTREKSDTDEHLLALTLALKCFQRLGRFAKAREVPPVVVEHVWSGWPRPGCNRRRSPRWTAWSRPSAARSTPRSYRRSGGD
ncbi:DUF4158 domain-containing protein [Nonomuraea sp. JJY05]|uniref:DUF4158 domain-containing protein n=1 Tax=Nonomuraea sp. JJY05 TaxID=3350255 RepID=UPI00373F531B